MSIYDGDVHNGYCQQRLEHTFVRLKDNGEFIYIVQFENKNRVTILKTIEDEDTTVVPLDSIDDTSPSFLGYCNYPYYTVTSIRRMPFRNDWRQGLRHHNLSIYSYDTLEKRFFGVPMTRDSLHNSLNTLIKKYPSFSECLDRVEDGFYCQCFSQNFCVSNCYELWHLDITKGPIGTINVENGKVELYKDYRFYREQLEFDKEKAG